MPPNTDEYLFSFENFRAWYSSKNMVVESGSMTVKKNSVVGLVGRNGAGKTTLVNSICGIHNKAAFENLCFLGHQMTVRDLRFKSSRYACFSKDESFRYWNLNRLITLIERSFALEHDSEYLDYLIRGFMLDGLDAVQLGEMSSGQRKKAALVSALYSRRKLLILDEPVDFLDFSSTEFLYVAIRFYAEAHGSIIMCSHVAESFVRCCSELYTIEEKRISGPYDVPKRAENVAKLFSK